VAFRDIRTICGQSSRGVPPPRKRMVERTFINIMLEYSAKKKRAKGPPEYSTLKPETSSDSPSVRSKGARFVSAKVDTYQIKQMGAQVRRNQESSWASVVVVRLKLPERTTTHRTIRPRLTS